jgi:CBS domain-containing protein
MKATIVSDLKGHTREVSMGAVSSVSKARKLRVLVREVHYGDGITARQLKVYCRRRARCIAVQECSTCDRCDGFAVDPSGRHSFLSCTYGDSEELAPTPSDATSEQSPSLAERTPIEQVMTKDVVCVTEDMAVDELTRLLLERGFSGVPVVDSQGTPVGVVSKTDLVRDAHERPNVREIQARLPTRDEEGYRAELGTGFHTESVTRTTVRDIMTPITYTLKASTSLAQAASLMAFEGVHRLPIVADGGGEVVGLLSALDILRWLGERNGYLLRHPEGDAGLVV